MAEPTLEASLAKYRLMVEDSEEMPPQLRVGLPSGTVASPPLAEIDEHPTDVLRALGQATQAGILPRPLWVLFASEGWSAQASTAEALETLERGELAARKAIGMTGVGEALIVHFAHSDGRTWAALQAFERKPALGTVAWGETSIDTEAQVGGAIPRALRAIVGLPGPSEGTQSL